MFSSLPPINLYSFRRLFGMEPKDTVDTENYMGYTNTQCEFFPCHTIPSNIAKDTFNCLFCYCPLIAYECKGKYAVYTDKRGNLRKDCSMCYYNHNGIKESWSWIQPQLENPKILVLKDG